MWSRPAVTQEVRTKLTARCCTLRASKTSVIAGSRERLPSEMCRCSSQVHYEPGQRMSAMQKESLHFELPQLADSPDTSGRTIESRELGMSQTPLIKRENQDALEHTSTYGAGTRWSSRSIASPRAMDKPLARTPLRCGGRASCVSQEAEFATNAGRRDCARQ